MRTVKEGKKADYTKPESEIVEQFKVPESMVSTTSGVPDEPLLRKMDKPASEKTMTHVVTDADSDLIFHAGKPAPDWGQEVASIGDDYELMKDPFAIPTECALRRERCEFAYRWLNVRNKDTFTVQTTGKIRWTVVNRNNAPYIKSVPFDDPGVIRKGDMVLAKMPWAMYLKRNQIYHSAAVLPKREGPKDEEGRYSVTADRLRSGDIVMAEERYNQRTKQAEVVDYGKHGVKWSGDHDAPSTEAQEDF